MKPNWTYQALSQPELMSAASCILLSCLVYIKKPGRQDMPSEMLGIMDCQEIQHDATPKQISVLDIDLQTAVQNRSGMREFAAPCTGKTGLRANMR